MPPRTRKNVATILTDDVLSDMASECRGLRLAKGAGVGVNKFILGVGRIVMASAVAVADAGGRSTVHPEDVLAALRVCALMSAPLGARVRVTRRPASMAGGSADHSLPSVYFGAPESDAYTGSGGGGEQPFPLVDGGNSSSCMARAGLSADGQFPLFFQQSGGAPDYTLPASYFGSDDSGAHSPDTSGGMYTHVDAPSPILARGALISSPGWASHELSAAVGDMADVGGVGGIGDMGYMSGGGGRRKKEAAAASSSVNKKVAGKAVMKKRIMADAAARLMSELTNRAGHPRVSPAANDVLWSVVMINLHALFMQARRDHAARARARSTAAAASSASPAKSSSAASLTASGVERYMSKWVVRIVAATTK